MAWNNDGLVVYHGTTTHALGLTWPSSMTQIGAAVGAFRPNVAHGQNRVDFSQGFYTTTVAHQAKQWANQGVRRLATRSPPVPAGAVVFEYEIERQAFADSDCLVFVLGSQDFFNFVRHCRRFPGQLRHDRHRRQSLLSQHHQDHYDVVFGPVSLGYQKLVLHGCDQISFHTQAKVDQLLTSPKLTIAASRKNGIV